LYCQANPINEIDLSGEFSLGEIVSVENISEMFNKLNLGTVYKVYNFADTAVSVINLYQQWSNGGNVSYFELGIIASNILPLGKIFSKVEICGNRLINASADLTELLKESGRTNKVVQTIGELGAEFTARKKGFKLTNFVKRYHGFDGVYKNGERFVIVEAKGGTGTLAENQMSKQWIRERIEKMLKDPENGALAKDLKEAFDKNMIDGMVVTTEIAGNEVKDPTFIIRNIKDIGEDSFKP